MRHSTLVTVLFVLSTTAVAACSSEQLSEPTPEPPVPAGPCVEAPIATTCGTKCGRVKNNCGKEVSCASCTLPEICGGKVANVCGERCVAALELLPKNPTVPTSTYTKLTVLATYGNGKREALNYATAPGNQVRFTGGESACDARLGCMYPIPNTVFINTYEVMNGPTVGTNAYSVRISGREACGGERVFSTVTSAVTTFTRVAGLVPNSITVSPTSLTVPKEGLFSSVVVANFATATGVAAHNISYLGRGPIPTIDSGCGTTAGFSLDLGFTPVFGWTNVEGVNCIEPGAIVRIGCGGGRIALDWLQAAPFPVGTTTIRYTLGARSALQTITVSAKPVARVTLAGWKSGASLVDGGGNIPVGINPRMRVNVTYADGTTDNEDSLATSITFVSSDPMKIAFAAPKSNRGEALAAGTTNITAKVGGVTSAPLTYTVTTAKLCEILAVADGVPADNQMVKNSTKSVRVLGRYRDSCPDGTFRTDLDIAGDVTSISENPAIVAVTTEPSGTRVRSFDTAAAAPGIKLKFSKDGVDGSLQTSGFVRVDVGMVVLAR